MSRERREKGKGTEKRVKSGNSMKEKVEQSTAAFARANDEVGEERNESDELHYKWYFSIFPIRRARYFSDGKLRAVWIYDPLDAVARSLFSDTARGEILLPLKMQYRSRAIFDRCKGFHINFQTFQAFQYRRNVCSLASISMFPNCFRRS